MLLTRSEARDKVEEALQQSNRVNGKFDLHYSTVFRILDKYLGLLNKSTVWL